MLLIWFVRLKESDNMTYSKAKRDYNVQYIKDNIKRVPLDVQKDKYETIKAAAEAAGESVNGYIKRAIDERMERDVAQAPASTTAHPYPERDIEGGDAGGQVPWIAANQQKGRFQKFFKRNKKDYSMKITIDNLRELCNNNAVLLAKYNVVITSIFRFAIYCV